MARVFEQTTIAADTRCGFLDRPGCRVYYEVTGSGPPIVFAHGIGSSYMTWWQQVAYFSHDFTCVTFSHRGYLPGSDIGVPDPKEFAGDLAALIGHLRLPDVRIVAQSMGGLTSMEYLLSHPQHNVLALILTSTSGSIDRSSVPMPEARLLPEWERNAATARADLQCRGISPPAGERMAREQPHLHFLYKAIANAGANFDREALRKRINAMRTRPAQALREVRVPTLFITGAEDTIFPPFVADALADLTPNGQVEQVRDAGHSVYFERAETFNDLAHRFLAGCQPRQVRK